MPNCSCGAQLNHSIDGVLQPKCYKCSTAISAILKPRAVGKSRAARAAVRMEAESLLDRIEGMLDLSRYQFARDTLEGIHETVERTGRVTDGQIRAVDNIESGANRR